MKINKSLYNDPDVKWTIVGKLVERCGSETEKIAWMLCRGEAAEWRLGINTTSIREIKANLKRKIRAQKLD